jgi:phage tail protein X
MRERFTTAADGGTVFVTIDGDTVDLIAHTYYGKHTKNTEAIYEANPGLAAKGPVFPAGLIIKIPPVSAKVEPKQFRRLWD